MTESISGLFMETITIRELVGMMKTDGKKLVFHPERFPYFLQQLNKNTETETEDEEVCSECGGEGQCDYGMGEDVKTMACEKCNDGSDEEDLAYDRYKDEQTEAYFDKLNDRD